MTTTPSRPTVCDSPLSETVSPGTEPSGTEPSGSVSSGTEPSDSESSGTVVTDTCPPVSIASESMTASGNTTCTEPSGSSSASSPAGSTTADRSIVIDNMSSTMATNPSGSDGSKDSFSGRRCSPKPEVASALTGTVTMLPPWPSGRSVMTTSEANCPASSVTASSAFGVFGKVSTGRVSTPTASPSWEFDNVTTPTVKSTDATITRPSATAAAVIVRRVLRCAMAVMPTLRTSRAVGSHREPAA